ncbi:hypothetical protein ACF0H5_019952 [Mactra antiquata]
MKFWIIYTVIYCLWITKISAIGCPTGWVSFESKCYLFSNDELKVYDVADVACLSKGAQLVSIETQNEDKFIANWLTSNTLSRHIFWYTSGKFSSQSRSIIWDREDQFSGYGTYWLENRRRLGDRSDKVYTLVYSFTGQTYEWANTTSSYVGAYICELSQSEVDYFYILERDFEYGYASLEAGAIQKGPVFVELSDDTVVFEEVRYVEVECIARSNPLSTYTFWRGKTYSTATQVSSSTRYTLTGGKLTIQDPIEEEDDDMYHCRATNSIGTTISEMIRVSFGYIGDFPNNEMEPLVAKAFEGTKMECHQPRFSPRVTFWWFRGFIGDMHISEGSENFFVSDSGSLYISEVQPTDADQIYYCVVTLSTPDGSKFAEGNVPSRLSLGQWLFMSPDSVTDNDYGPIIYTHVFPTNVLRGNQIRIECIAYGTLPLYYSWHREDGRPFVEGTTLSDLNRVLIIENAPLEAEGNYVCTCLRGTGSVASQTVIINMDAVPYFPYPIGNMFADPGMRLVWNCRAVAKPSAVYTWYKNGELLVDVPGQYKIKRGQLMILNVDKERDEGIYQCAATNTHGTTFSTGQLKVLRIAPNFDRFPLPAQTYGAIGGNITIKCSVEAAPNPEVRWLKNGGDMNLYVGDQSARVSMDASFSLVIRDLQFGDAAPYTCLATNNLGDARNSTYLRVSEGVIISVPPAPTTVTVNRTAFMYCDVSYSPNLDVAYVWKFNGYIINTTLSPEFIVGTQGGINGLQITRTQFKNSGLYECQLKTSVQSVSKSARLTVRGPPGPPAGVHIDQSSVTTRSVRIFWTISIDSSLGGIAGSYDIEADTNFEPNVWRLVMRDIPDFEANNIAVNMALRTDQRAFNITDLIPNTHYRFRVRGINEYGRGAEASMPSESAKTPATKPVISPRNVGGGGGSVGTLTISWDLLKPAEQCGPGIGYHIYWKSTTDTRDWAKIVGNDTLALKHGKTVITNGIGVENYYLPYLVKVGAYNSHGSGPNSTVVQVFSAEGMPQGSPIAYDIETYNGTSVIVYWKPVPDTREAVHGRVKGYRVYYYENEHDESPFTGGEPDPVRNRILFKDVYGQTDHCQLVGLTNNAEYFARVQVFNGAGFGPKGEWRRAETANDILKDYPIHVKVFPRDRHSVIVRWRGVSGHPGEEAVRGYIIRVWKVQQDIRNAIDTEVEKDNEAVIDNLQTNEVYVLRVLGWSNAGDGALSEIVYFVISGDSSFGVQIDPTTSDICFIDENASTCDGNINYVSLTLLIVSHVLLLCPEDGIYHIPGKIDALFNLDFCKWTRNCLQVKLASMKTVSEATDSKLEQLHEVRYAAIEEVHTLQRALESLITQAVETSKKEIETECKKLEEEILKDKENADNASDALQESDKELEKADGNRAQTFVCSKVVEKKMKEINLTDGNVELSFTAKKLLMRHINSAGGISQILGNTETKDDIYEVKEDKDINIRISSDEETCSSYGCCQIDEVNILVADCNNRKIKRIDLHTMEIVEHCALLAEPFDLTVVNKHVVAIACINPNMIAFVYIDSKMVLFKQVGMTHCCRGIICKDDKLYVTNGKSIVYVYNLSGVLQRTVQYDSEGNNTFSNSVYMAFSNSGRKLFVTNLNDGLVCLDEELNHLSTVKYADLKAVEGICNDGRGNIFVVGKDSNNVVQFDEDGKRFGAIVDDMHGLRKPMSVCYLKEQNRLFVTMAESNVMKMFELK